MKRRKSPVALITVGIFAAIGLFIAAKPFGDERLSMEEKMAKAAEAAKAEQIAQMAKSPTKPTAPDVSKENADLANQMKASAGAPRGPKPGMGAREMTEHGELPPDPVIIKKEDTVYIPKPNSSSTSSQWYDQK